MVNSILDSIQNFRYERKFHVTELTDQEMDVLIRHHPSLFNEIYQERNVNNIYFDTLDKQSYMDNKDGLTRRLKVRIRWYGELFGKVEQPVLEFKVKHNLHIGKLSYPLKSFVFNEDIALSSLRRIMEESDLPAVICMHLKQLDFSLVNRYRRKYFLSADRRFRLTKDLDLEVLRIAPFGNIFIEKIKDDRSIILELKYTHAQEEEAEAVTRHFPFRATRSSKYVNGIERLEVW